MNAVATPRVQLAAVQPADPYAADPGRTGVRPAYRPQTFITDAEGQWNPSRLLIGMHQPQSRQTEGVARAAKPADPALVQRWPYSPRGDRRTQWRRM